MPKHRYSAAQEVAVKSARAIERETAKKWLARALACWARHDETAAASWRSRAEHYADEAREHAALAKDGGRSLAAVERALAGACSRRKTSVVG